MLSNPDVQLLLFVHLSNPFQSRLIHNFTITSIYIGFVTSSIIRRTIPLLHHTTLFVSSTGSTIHLSPPFCTRSYMVSSFPSPLTPCCCNKPLIIFIYHYPQPQLSVILDLHICLKAKISTPSHFSRDLSRLRYNGIHKWLKITPQLHRHGNPPPPPPSLPLPFTGHLSFKKHISFTRSLSKPFLLLRVCVSNDS